MTKLLTLAVVGALAASVAVASAPARPADTRNIVQTAVAAGEFKTLATLLTKVGLVSTLKQRGPYTVFAPTDAAFKKVPKQTLQALLGDKAKLKAVLLYHVVSGKVTAADVLNLSSAKTLAGKTVRIRTPGANVFVGGARVTTPNVMATNGVIHVIDKVLIPPAR